METIFSYVESVFQNLPKTPAMNRLKEDMLRNMEEKYLDLKAEGASEQAAIGTVLSEFGNINEIIDEYELNHESTIEEEVDLEEDSDFVVMTQDQVDKWFLHRNRYSFGIASGVFLCIFGVVAMMIGFSIFGDQGDTGPILSVAALLLFVAIGVGVLITFGMQEERSNLTNKHVRVDARTHAAIKTSYEEFQKGFPVAITTGVVLCIIGVILLLISVALFESNPYLGVILLLAFVATGVFILIHNGIVNSTYQKILQIGEYSPQKVKAAKVTDQLASIVFPLATLFYLYMGFVNDAWGSAWIVFPVVGVAFGILSTIIESLTSMNKRR